MATHYLDDTQPHAFWDNSFPPRLLIQPGDTVVFETLEGIGQVTPDWKPEDFVSQFDISLVHPLREPVYVEGAEPGDVLVIEVIDLKHKGWGYSLAHPEIGLLADEFSDIYIHHYNLVENFCEFRSDIHIPFEPFCGVMGVAQAETGRLNTIPPRMNGGNVDIRHLTPGTTVYLPVLTPGALFSCGDCHAAQGDGEVNGTGIESPMTVTLRFHLHQDRSISELQFRTAPGKKLTLSDSAGYFVTTAHGPDLYENSQQAVRYMIDYLVAEYTMTRE